jgi:formylglycine-generating enzyme required for sulfatase activity
MAYLPYTKYPRPCMWLVRGDAFTMGGGCSGEPAFEADVGSFYISRSCLSNEAFQAFRPDFVPSPASPGPEDPAVGVSFEDATAYCTWWAEVSRKPFRLPTEIEWELACGGGRTERYPWGDSLSGGESYAFSAENTGEQCPALEALRPSDQGLFGMIGGVWEWTATRMGTFPIAASEQRDRLAPSGERVIRGGSFREPLADLGTRIRKGAAESTTSDNLGFRIVRSL